MTSFTEENYLKAIYRLQEQTSDTGVSTTSLAAFLETKASSVTDMLKKLSDKGLVHYQKYKGVLLTEEGEEIAVRTIRKHRLWEVFLVKHLDFKWDEVHEVAEELEHIKSEQLIISLEKFLGYPKTDPHGDPIPDVHGRFRPRKDILLAEMEEGSEGIVVGVKDHAPAFLKYLESLPLLLGAHIKVLKHFEFDDSRLVQVNHTREVTLSLKVCTNLSLHQD